MKAELRWRFERRAIRGGLRAIHDRGALARAGQSLRQIDGPAAFFCIHAKHQFGLAHPDIRGLGEDHKIRIQLSGDTAKWFWIGPPAEYERLIEA
ncbi:MAG: hypothetical protein HY736_07370 [Verrucomicrobia bacterium]|nr:hypothetical protein [Verrucomicrobiota bacterium]